MFEAIHGLVIIIRLYKSSGTGPTSKTTTARALQKRRGNEDPKAGLESRKLPFCNYIYE